MKIFSRTLSCKWRLTGFISFLLVLLILAGFGGINSMRSFHLTLADTYHNKVIPVADLREINHVFQTEVVHTVDTVLLGQISRDEALKKINGAKDTLDKKWSSLNAIAEANPEFSQYNWFEPSKDIIAATDELTTELIRFLEKNDTDSLDTFTDGTLYPFAEKHHDTISILIEERLASVKTTYDDRIKDFDLRKKIFLSAMLITLVISVFASYLLIRSIDVPLKKITNAMKRVIKGDLTQHLDYGRHDEFGLLIKGFNQMVTYLRDLVGQIQRSGIQVTSSITELAATNKQQEVTANEHAATSSEIAASTTEIAATGAHLLKTMKKVNSLTKNAGFAAQEGQEGLLGIDNTMVKMEEATGSIVTKLQILNDKASNIAGMVKTINKVADQTNLLSLNAAIEAEKAGEYGSGFAVVATEIRRLADQTAIATFDIAQMVKDVQSAISAAVMGIDKFADDAHTSVQEVRATGEMLSGVIEQVEVLIPQVSSLTEGIDAQTQGAEQISDAIGQLNEAAQQTAQSLTQTSSSISMLHHAALGLMESTARFKVEADYENAAPPV